MKYYLGVDVGTKSARAGLFDENGKSLCVVKKDVLINNYNGNFYEQSSNNIWKSLCWCIKQCIDKTNVNPQDIVSIGFDATCSLVALDKNYQPISVGKHKNNDWNIIMWMDHRAKIEQNLINSKNHPSLQYVGGKVSIEMELPKILWLKNNLSNDDFNKIKYFMDLPDYLVFKATGQMIKSDCSLGCKWNYMPYEKKWDLDLLKSINLESLLNNISTISSNKIQSPTTKAGELSKDNAQHMGLLPNTIVATSMIDAHAGALSLLGLAAKDKNSMVKDSLAIVSGTSNCFLALSKDKILINGIWGPYYNAIVPGYWCHEAGQSATGSLIDYILNTLSNLKKHLDTTNPGVLFDYLDKLPNEKNWEVQTKNYHVLPYFLGNRSPISNPHLVGMISGLRLDYSYKHDCIKYLAFIQAICYGALHIINCLNEKGYSINKIYLTGGFSNNEVFLKSLANITGLEIVLPEANEAVLLGSAFNGLLATKVKYSFSQEASRFLHKNKRSITPERKNKKYHQNKYKVFLELYLDQIKYNNTMQK